MRLFQGTILTIGVACAVSGVVSGVISGAVSAQEFAPGPDLEAGPAPPDRRASAGPATTGKERLGEKWTDEQRVDNCGVPPERRGDTPRPDLCASGGRE